METYGRILLIAMPAFLILVLFEKWWGWRKNNDTVQTMDMISSLYSGVTNAVKDVLQLSITILAYGWLVQKIALYHIQTTWLTYVVAFLVIDFAGYWVHRWNHRINFFWNYHLIHHSSEEFNLACALRQSISAIVNPFSFLLIPAALLGVPAIVIATVGPLHLFAQFWYHTRHIGKMGFLEHIIVTPSHHRVHHAINTEYIDKNMGQIFIFWDKIFGTYQEELASAPPVFGITHPVQTWNPIKINFQHLWLMMQDAWHTKSMKDAIRIWAMPTGWRPADVVAKYPVHKIENVYAFEKYNPRASNQLKAWSIFQMVMILFFISFLFGTIAQIGVPGMFIYGAFVFMAIYAHTELMNRNPYAVYWEAAKNMFGLAVITITGSWFGVATYTSFVDYLLLGYFVIATLITTRFCMVHKKEDALNF